MSPVYLIDTDVLGDLINGQEYAIEFLDNVLRPGFLLASAVTYAEVYAGVFASSDPDLTRARIEHFFATTHIEIVSLAGEPARNAGLLYGSLVSRGLRTGLPDLLNASIAIVHDYTIVTRNVRHYVRVPNLKILSPDTLQEPARDT
jgi:predicted nucleic acid-binding protein